MAIAKLLREASGAGVDFLAPGGEVRLKTRDLDPETRATWAAMAEEWGMRLRQVVEAFPDRIDDLYPEDQWAGGDEAKIERLARAIEAHEPLPPLLVNEDGMVKDGNHRLEAARRLGLKTVPVVQAEEAFVRARKG